MKIITCHHVCLCAYLFFCICLCVYVRACECMREIEKEGDRQTCARASNSDRCRQIYSDRKHRYAMRKDFIDFYTRINRSTFINLPKNFHRSMSSAHNTTKRHEPLSRGENSDTHHIIKMINSWTKDQISKCRHENKFLLHYLQA